MAKKCIAEQREDQYADISSICFDTVSKEAHRRRICHLLEEEESR